MKQAWETAVAYKLVWLRVIGYMIVPSIGAFLAICNTIDIDSKWAQMGPFSRAAFWLGVAMPGIGAFMAFLDQSLQRKREEIKEKREGETAMFIKENPSSGL
jgi:hypothetical protein